MIIKYRYMILMFWIVFGLELTSPCLAYLGYPVDDEKRYPNPYQMMIDSRIGNIEHHEEEEVSTWWVVSNQKDAPIYAKREGEFERSGRADYLQVFVVEERTGKYLRVIPVKGKAQPNQWMHMKNLILIQRSIRKPKTETDLKVFPLVQITHQEVNPDVLRFRSGPGEPGQGNNYSYLTSRDEVIRAGNLFLYVYGVYFRDDADKMYCNDDRGRINFDSANYFLVGTSPGLGIDNGELEKKNIKGWLPASGAVLWGTRQALEIESDRRKKWAHIFTEESDLTEYFEKSGDKKKSGFLNEIQQNIVQDNNRRPPGKGRDLRYIVFDRHSFDSTEYVSIGYTGQEGGTAVTMPPPNSGGIITPEDIQLWGKNIQIFFLIDATQSMKPCFEAAAKVVENIIEKFKIKSSVNISFRAAVFRDRTDGRKKRFVEWDPKENPDLPTWFRRVECRTFGDDKTFEESLFYGIKMAASTWSNKFTKKFGTRLMFILGDTGNDPGDSDSSLNQVVPLLKRNIILPKAIRFIHKEQGKTEESRKKEKMAMNRFTEHMEQIYEAIYKDKDFVGIEEVDVRSLEEKQGSERLQSEAVKTSLESLTTSAVQTSKAFVDSLPSSRMGQKTIIEILCDMGYPEEKSRECRQSDDLNELQTFIARNKPRQRHGIDIGFPVAMLTLLGQRCPDCVSWLADKPETGFAKGFMAVKAGKHKISRPVLLLSHRELRWISRSTNDLIKNYKRCKQNEVHKHMVSALSTILGMVLETDPNDVSGEKMEKWFSVIVDPGRSMVNVNNLAYKLCKDKRWKPLADRLKKVPDNINRIVNQMSDVREYVDLAGLSHFWVYPEEVFPPPGGYK